MNARKRRLPQRKLVQAVCYGMIAFGPQHASSWEDVWLRFKLGRRVVTWAPCLLGQQALEADLHIAEELHQAHPDSGFGAELPGLRAIRADLSVAPYVSPDLAEPCPNLYTSARLVTRAEAERMLAWALEARFGVRCPKFSWPRPDFVVQSVPLAEAEDA